MLLELRLRLLLELSLRLLLLLLLVVKEWIITGSLGRQGESLAARQSNRGVVVLSGSCHLGLLISCRHTLLLRSKHSTGMVREERLDWRRKREVLESLVEGRHGLLLLRLLLLRNRLLGYAKGIRRRHIIRVSVL